jgi:hypothetical protein
MGLYIIWILRCRMHGATLLGSMCLLIDNLFGQLHELLGEIHVICLGATFLSNFRRRDCRSS